LTIAEVYAKIGGVAKSNHFSTENHSCVFQM
jgi:hypothetical protein